MSLAHPAVLHGLLDQYEQLRGQKARTAEDQQRLDKVTHALCVAGGTPDLGSALTAVRRHLRSPVRPSCDRTGADAADFAGGRAG